MMTSMGGWSRQVHFATGFAIGTTVSVIARLLYNKFSCNSNNPNELVLSLGNVWPFTEVGYKEEVHIITNEEDINPFLRRLIKDVEQSRCLGFDCEWVSKGSHRNKISLMQIATHTGLCILIRMCKYKGKLPKELLEILKSKDIFKVGVGAFDDANTMMKDHGITIQGCLDLRSFAVRHRITQPHGLQKLSKEILNITMEKSYKIRCSNWENERLSDKQISYAANDALCAVEIFRVFLARNFVSNFQNNNEVTQIVTESIKSYIHLASHNLIDIKYKQMKNRKYKRSESRQSSTNKMKMQTMKDPKLYKPMKKHSTRQNPLYDNCKLEAPDGQLLSTCDKKKAQWYVHKNLAEIVNTDPFTVRLFFEPSGRPDDDRDYYLYDKENKCVVCAATQYLVRKNIIPHEYRKHFPICMKDHVSHDILLLCLYCHQQTNYNDCIMRRALADEFSAPMGSVQTVRLLEDPDRRSVRSAARAILKAGDRLPELRRKELEETIKRFFHEECLSVELIEKASELETRVKNESYVPHGEKVVSVIKNKDGIKGLLDFEIRWRNHFVNTMQPKFMPHLWSLDHNHDKVMRRIEQDSKWTNRKNQRSLKHEK